MERVAAKRFQELLVWQKAHQLTLAVYRLTEVFPKHELFALTSQLRRAAISVPANIAEGFRKRGLKDKIRFFNIAEGSLEEVHYYFILAQDLGYANTQLHTEQANEVGRMLEAYGKAMRTTLTTPSS
ncbi:four helix bundle protein [Hymenobacter sp. BT770]|uniref:four helix bundle protein n=1 Tax=Hymenobacter sp. BT770 TaxID=2886942 RepID=UPI001D100ADE|nr:four helix bundle protein [Hymenobacter sp. BT770]MCC3153692.1 four helix bundle protein [Hymenobacter sp. BT770]MDO3415842.1 four helix bundle protein [Hymenobacter sp. BT770]